MGVAKSMTLRGEGGPTLSVTMTLIFPKIVWTCPLTLSTLQEKGDFSMEAAVEFKHPLFQLERNTKHNGRIFTPYPVNASENGDLNRGRKSFQANTMLKILTRANEKTKRSWIYMRENGVDSPYLFLHCVFSIDASPAHP